MTLRKPDNYKIELKEMKKTIKELMEECGMDTSKLHLYESQQSEVVPIEYQGSLEDFLKENNAVLWEDFKSKMMEKWVVNNEYRIIYTSKKLD